MRALASERTIVCVFHMRRRDARRPVMSVAHEAQVDCLQRKWPRRHAGAPARPWLATVLRNLFRMQRRAGARREQREGLGSSASTTTVEPGRELAKLEVLRILLAELDRLAPGDQKILVGRFFEGKSGAVTLSVTKIGAPDVGTIHEDVEIVETTYEDKEVLQCLIESMVGWVGEAPAESFERRETRTFVLGEVTADVKDRRQFEFIIGAHINEVRWCEARGQPDAAAVSGRARMAFETADDPEGKTRSRTAVVGDTDLPREIVDCIITASQRWIFPAAMRGRTFEYGFVLPVAGPRPR